MEKDRMKASQEATFNRAVSLAGKAKDMQK